MSEFFFVVKTALFSALLLMILQMKVGGSTLEQQAEGWIYHSRAGVEMKSMARGAIRAGREGFNWAREQTHDVSASIHNATAEESAEPSARQKKQERSSRNRSRFDDLD
jgi:hypothetical protein